ncbi:hypothetical protein Anapl_03038 [Anas platyrhynchos]|uniref:Uncharacterized protein n=1 Tax=Anas platyrhynchos TaxID=8839 RepID=R0LDF2_ANAPL|nr:hypothetical protein Anapl_03038 [Anas platyrhynchos]
MREAPASPRPHQDTQELRWPLCVREAGRPLSARDSERRRAKRCARQRHGAATEHSAPLRGCPEGPHSSPLPSTP